MTEATQQETSPEWLEELEALCDSTGIPLGAYEAWASNFHLELSDFADFTDELQTCWQGEYSSDTDFAEELADNTGLIPESMPHYWVDWEAIARDLLMGDFWETDGYYFSSY